MAAVRMWIDKFQGEVLINEDHPLAVAQRARNVAGTPAPVEGQPQHTRAEDQDAAMEAALEAGTLPPADRREVKRRPRKQ